MSRLRFTAKAEGRAKDGISIRPIWHRTEARVRAQVQMAWSALAVDRVLQLELRAKAIGRSSGQAWEVGADTFHMSPTPAIGRSPVEPCPSLPMTGTVSNVLGRL